MAEFIDFQISAWQVDANSVQVMVNSSPVGAMHKPVDSSLDAELGGLAVGDDQLGWPGSVERAIDLGRMLSAVLLPDPVHSLLIRSLERIDEDDGLRVRICLDPLLAHLPWEFLYKPDTEEDSIRGFLVLDSRVSLVREAPTLPHRTRAGRGRKRVVLAGASVPGPEDVFGIQEELRELPRSLESMNELLVTESIPATEQEIKTALSKPAAIFHYAGHTDQTNGRGYLLSEMKPGAIAMYGDQLAGLLREAGTRLAVFTACNSGRWTFAEPLIRAGLPALIGARGVISSVGAIAFGQKLYASLMTGMSLDEAITWGRLHLVEAGTGEGSLSFEWGSFIVYMPTTEAVLFPAPERGKVREFREAARRDRRQTIINVVQNIGTVSGQVTGVSAAAIGVAAGPMTGSAMGGEEPP